MRALLLGGGRGLWEEVAPFRHSDAQVFAVNDAGVAWDGPLHHWCSVHAEKLEHWAFCRNHRSHEEGGRRVWFPHNPGTRFHTSARPQRNYPLPGWVEAHDIPGSGTSALFALRIAIHLGFERILICGVPLDGSGRFWDPPWKDKSYARDRSYWSEVAGDPRIRATSGYTREIFGAPEEGWF